MRKLFLWQGLFTILEKRVFLLILCVSLNLSGCIGGIGFKYKADPKLYPEPPRNAITFWGHACSYIDINGFGIITDPVFEPTYGTFHKRIISAPPPAAYDQTQIVLISHPHHDHLSPKTLSRFPSDVRIICPVPSAKYLDDSKQQIYTMRPGDVYDFPGGKIVAVAAHHPGYRYSLKARSDGRALGYIIITPEQTVFYSGDSEYFEGFKQVGRTYKPSLAILNISTHLGTREALRVVRDLGVRKLIPTHYGAYSSSKERETSKYRSDLADYLGSIWLPLQVGESCTLDGEPLP